MTAPTAYGTAPDLALAALRRYAAARASSDDPGAFPEAITASHVLGLIRAPRNGRKPSLATVTRALAALAESGDVERVGRLWRARR